MKIISFLKVVISKASPERYRYLLNINNSEVVQAAQVKKNNYFHFSANCFGRWNLPTAL